jgi:hypothetical protein
MRTRIIISLLLVLAGPLSAHQGGHDVRGVVTSVSAQEITVKTSKGSEKFVLTPETEFVKDGSPSGAQDLEQSDRAVVHAREKNGRMEAIKVQFSSAKH